MEDTKEKNSLLKNKTVIISCIIAISIILLSLICAVVLKKQIEKDNDIKYTDTSNGIKISANMKSNSDVIIVMKNETGKTVSKLQAVVKYLDASGNILTEKTSTTDVYLKNKEISLNYIKSDIVDLSKIANYKVEVIPEFYSGEERLSNYEKIDISETQEKDGKIYAIVKNKIDKTISYVCFYAVYFKNDLPVGLYAQDIYSLKGEKEISFEKPHDKDGNKINYDYCKVYIKY